MSGGGTRGAPCSASSNEIYLPTPEQGEGALKTAQARPTFTWRLREAAQAQMRFVIVQPGQADPIWEAHLPAKGQQFVRYELPAEAPPLKAGQRYQWGVEVECSEQQRLRNPIATAYLKRVPAPQAVEAASTPRQKLDAYNQHGLALDALGLLSARADWPEGLRACF